MSKEVENNTCYMCESVYKLTYESNDVTSLPKFCPYCGSDAYDDSVEEDDEYLNDGG